MMSGWYENGNNVSWSNTIDECRCYDYELIFKQSGIPDDDALLYPCMNKEAQLPSHPVYLLLFLTDHSHIDTPKNVSSTTTSSLWRIVFNRWQSKNVVVRSSKECTRVQACHGRLWSRSGIMASYSP